MQNQTQISVIIPALNEEKNILSAINSSLDAFADFHIRGEIVVINDGSSDATAGIVQERMKSESRIRMIRHEKPCGIGVSFWEGVDIASGDIVVMLPGDNENDPWEILRYYRLLEHVDIVIPFLFNRQTRSILRNALSFIYRFIVNTTFLVNFNYTNGTILYRRSILKELNYRSSGFFFQTDILIRIVKKGYLFAEVPYQVGLRKKGGSKAVTFPSLINVMKGYIHLFKDYHFKRGLSQGGHFSLDSQTAIRRNDEIHKRREA